MYRNLSSEILHRIDVFRKWAVDRDYAYQIGIRINELPRRFVAVQSHKLMEEWLRKQHRVAFSALIRSKRDLAIALSPLVSHAIYCFRIDPRLVTQNNDDRFRSRVERPDPRAI